MEDWYLTLYTLLSFAAHGAISDLESRAVVDADGAVVEFKSEPELANQQAVWAWATEVALAAMRALSQLFALNTAEIEILAQRLQALSDSTNAG
jgi:predicted regulator of Ras-like GTPase activity (Roadblock/LC7/MglB family)